MDYQGVTKRSYKSVKREISEDTAINVGYYTDVLGEIPNYILLDVVREISSNGWIRSDIDDVELQNMLVTESVKRMGYQEFKNIAHKFFNFNPDDEEKFKRVQPVEVTRENYEYLVENANKVFSLEKKLEDIQKEINSLDNKINELETTIVKNGDEVIGVDLEREQLLLLKSPENIFLDEDIIQDESLLNNYRSSDDDHTQILNALVEKYSEIKELRNEYVLNNDTYRGNIDIDYYAIDEINPDDIPISEFSTHKDYYNYGTQFDSFKEKYSSYSDYIEKTFTELYDAEYIPDYSKEILKEKEREINSILENHEKYLVTKDVIGYSQGEKWTLGYLADDSQYIDDVEMYLENYIGAWYRGSLTEVQVIPFEAFDQGKYQGGVDNIYYIDSDLLYHENLLEMVKEHYPELKNFKTEKEVEKLEQLKEKENKDVSRGRSL